MRNQSFVRTKGLLSRPFKIGWFKGAIMQNMLKYLSALLMLLSTMQVYAEMEMLPEINAKYETMQCVMPCDNPVKREWWMMRESNRIEFRDFNKTTGELAKQSEMWIYHGNNKSSYFFLMHQDMRAIEYLFDDLKILGRSIDKKKWQQLTKFVTSDELASFTKRNTKSALFQGYQVESYEGRLGEAQINLAWLPTLNIPVRLEYVYATRKTTIQLSDLYTDDRLKEVPKTTDKIIANYQQVYYTDIGDMEDNPRAQEWIAKTNGAPGLHHHH